MKNFNELVPYKKVEFDIGETDFEKLEYLIYDKFFSEIFINYINEQDKKYSILDMFCSRSYLNECINGNQNINYKKIDIIREFKRLDKTIEADVVDVNNMDFENNSFDVIFSPGDKLGYGKYHESLFEVERILKKDGYLIVNLSKFWYNIGFNQMLFCYRNWKYLQSIEINYKFFKNNNYITSSKYFLIYKFYGN